MHKYLLFILLYSHNTGTTFYILTKNNITRSLDDKLGIKPNNTVNQEKYSHFSLIHQINFRFRILYQLHLQPYVQLFCFLSRIKFHHIFQTHQFLNYKYEQYRIIDSMPIPVCKFGRAHFHRTFRHEATYGKCTSKKETYFRFKLHALISFDGYLIDFTLTPANIDDRTAAWELTDQSYFLWKIKRNPPVVNKSVVITLNNYNPKIYF